MINDNILQAIGGTPLIRLNRMTGEEDAEILVKFEGLNVGGSIKTRTAYAMLQAAEREGLIQEGSLIVEPTSGNQGIGLALVGAVKGYKTVIVMPDSVSVERRKLIKAYGAKVVLVHDKGNIGECIEKCIQKAEEIARSTKGAFMPQQFENENNPLVHRQETAQEILNDIDGRIDGFVSGIGTGGTITGIGEALKEKYPDMTVWAVEPENAAILAGGTVGAHIQMGIGDGLVPPVLNKNIYDDICIISDEEAISTTRELARKEGLLCGITGGTNVAAARSLAKKLGRGKRVVTVLPDTAERYFSTPLFEGI
ncbi:MAG: cysteine synthase A [Clostridia bacterium]|nr:cysteine synthase A [Clostridia bacterium]